MQRIGVRVSSLIRVTGPVTAIQRLAERAVRIALIAVLTAANIASAPSHADAATPATTVIWDSHADFENNLPALPISTTIDGLSADAGLGSLKLTPGYPNPVTAVAIGGDIVVLRSDGTVGVVGGDTDGQADVSGWRDITAVAAGFQHTVGLKSDNTVVATGNNSWTQCDVSTWSDITEIAAGSWHTVGLKRDGTVVAVGDNTAGQTDVSGWTDITAIAAGIGRTVGLKRDGTVVVTGGANGDMESKVSGWSDIVAIATGAGVDSVFGIKRDGTVLAAGDNSNGQSEISSWTDIKAIASDSAHTVGLKSDGTVVAVGDLSNTQTDFSTWTGITAVAAGLGIVGITSNGTLLADGFVAQSLVTPWTDIVSASSAWGFSIGLKRDGSPVVGGQDYPFRNEIASWSDLTAVTQGFQSAIGLKRNGTVVAAGYGYYGDTNVSSWSDIVAIDAGMNYTIGLKRDGKVLGIGLNDSGQTDVSGWTDIVAIAAGEHHTVGLRRDGTVVATGANMIGETDVSGWTDIVAIAAGTYDTVGLKRDGTVVSVGFDGVSVPPNVGAWTDIVAIAAGTYHTVGLKADGTVVSAGYDGDAAGAMPAWTKIKTLAPGYVSTIGIERSGRIVLAGGNLSIYPQNFPTPVYPDLGTIGGPGSAVGLRTAVPVGAHLSGIEVSTTPLWPDEAVKLAVRVSQDGSSWSEPLGSDGEPIDWTTGTGNYFGQAETDASNRIEAASLPEASYVDIVMHVESGTLSTPEVKSVTAVFAANATEPITPVLSTPASSPWSLVLCGVLAVGVLTRKRYRSAA